MKSTILAYKRASRSAKVLAQALNLRLAFERGVPFLKKRIIVNWGTSTIEREYSDQVTILNHPNNVAKAINKRLTFTALKEANVPIPEFVTNRNDVSEDWNQIVVRHTLTGHSGEGIEIIDKGNNIPLAPLYVEYIKKIAEYRVHVGGDKAIFIQQKRRDRGVPDDRVNWKVRNLEGGFIFAHKDIELTAQEHGLISSIAVDAIKALGLDFGAVDIIHNKDRGFFVLEINTACGLTGETIEKYRQYFSEIGVA